MDQPTIQDLSSTGRHQECIEACQQLLQSEPENPLPWKYAGKSLLALGQFEKAQQCLKKAHQADNKDPETAKDIGNSYLKLGKADYASEWYNRSIEIDNHFAPAISNLASLEIQSGRNREAIELYKQAIQADPQLIQAYLGAANCLIALKDFDTAKIFATKAIDINKDFPGTNEALGIILQNQGNPRQAVKYYQNELAVNPKSNTSLLNLGLLLLQQGEAAEAIKQLERAAETNPSDQYSLLLAQAYQNIGKLKEAIIEYKKIDIPKAQNKMIPFNLGLCMLNTGSNIDAIEAFKSAIKLDESFVQAWGNMGNALLNEGRHLEALTVTQKVLRLDPNCPTAHMNLGSIYKDLGNLDQALASTLKSLELKPDNPDALMNLGAIYKKLGSLDQALDCTLKSLEHKPDNPTARMNLGGIYKDLGNLDQAIASNLKSLELKPNNPDAYINLGGIYQDLGDLEQALASTLKSLELIPDNPDALINLGGIYKNLGNLDQALASTLKSLELKPNNANGYMNLGTYYEILNELDSALASYTKSANLIAQNENRSCLTSLISSTILLLQMNKMEHAKSALAKAYETASKKDTYQWKTSKEDNKHDRAYLIYLSKLMPKIPQVKAKSEPQVLHLGESHCLTFTNQTIELKGKKCSVKPSLIKGAKAFHLSEKSSNNPYKIGFEKRILQNLEDYEHIFLSFGEIDSREDEGILRYCKKTGKAIQDVSKSTAISYFMWTTKSLSRQKDKLVYFGTPAPFMLDQARDESSEINKQRLLAIKTFNTTLAEQCQESGVLFADVYQLTARNDGYNSNIWMLDSVHLKPKALHELLKFIDD